MSAESKENTGASQRSQTSIKSSGTLSTRVRLDDVGPLGGDKGEKFLTETQRDGGSGRRCWAKRPRQVMPTFSSISAGREAPEALTMDPRTGKFRSGGKNRRMRTLWGRDRVLGEFNASTLDFGWALRRRLRDKNLERDEFAD